MSEIGEEKIDETGKFGVNSGKCAGVYDKKLLWRANLYIDEGSNDWNDQNPWDTSDNAWNADGDGGQVDISPWTTANSNANVSRAVAYAHGCCDSPFNFFADLDDQQAYIQDYYSNDNPLWTTENPNPHPEWAQWNNTTAPDGDWDNYRLESYVPNLTEYYRRLNGSYSTSDRRHSAGVDCVSFVKRSANYGGLAVGYPDTIDDMDRDTIDSSPFISNYSTVGIHANSVRIYVYNVDNVSLLNLVVPGDYVQIDGHAALVGKISFYNGRNTTTSRITLIESTTFDNEWFVQNDQLLSQYGNNFIAIWRFNQN